MNITFRVKAGEGSCSSALFIRGEELPTGIITSQLTTGSVEVEISQGLECHVLADIPWVMRSYLYEGNGNLLFLGHHSLN